MYETILVTLEATPTDRAIIEHVKKLAAIMKSRVVLLHVATSAVAQWHGPDAAGEEVEEGQAYLNRVKAEFEVAGVPAVAQLRLRHSAGKADHQMGRGKPLRPRGNEHARPPPSGRHFSGENGFRRTAQH